jgi:hypothetical protein
MGQTHRDNIVSDEKNGPEQQNERWDKRTCCPGPFLSSLTLWSRFVCPIAHSVCPIAHFVVTVRLFHSSLCCPCPFVPSLILLFRPVFLIAHYVVPVRLSHHSLCCPGLFVPSLPVVPVRLSHRSLCCPGPFVPSITLNKVRDGTNAAGQQREGREKRSGTTE